MASKKLAHPHARGGAETSAAEGGRGAPIQKALRCLTVLATALLAHRMPGAGATGTTSFSYEGYQNATLGTPLAQSQATAAALLNGLTLRVALLSIAQNNTFYPDNITYGDGNAYLSGVSDSSVIPLLRAGDPNTASAGPFGGTGFAVPVQASQVDGASVWILKYVAAAANMSIQFDVVRLPWSVYYQSSKNDTLARTLYTLDALGYDAVATSFFVLPERMRWVRYLLPHQPYGFEVVTTQPTVEADSVVTRMFAWTRPFSGPMWGLLVASIVASALCYYVFEANTGSDDFPLPDEPPKDKFARALFLSAMSSVLFEGFSPHTHEGRLYTAVKGFVFFVSMSCFIAQYAAILGEPTAQTQAVNSINSFETLNKPVCVRQNAAQISFVTTNFPNLQVLPIPGLTQAGLLPAIVSGQCVGGVGPDIEVKYGLGGPGIFDVNGFDPQETFCGLTTVGEKLNFGYYGIPFTLSDRANVNDTVLRAMNVFVAQAINTGAYLTAAETYFPDVPSRPQCQAVYQGLKAATIRSPVLQIQDMAGLFLLQGAGTVLAMGLYMYRMHRKWTRDAQRRAAAGGQAVEELEEREDGLEKHPHPHQGDLGEGLPSAHGLKVSNSGNFTRRFVSPSGKVALVPSTGGDTLSLGVLNERGVSSEADMWGQRTGMERRLTNMLQELALQLDEVRSQQSTLAAKVAGGKQ